MRNRVSHALWAAVLPAASVIAQTPPEIVTTGTISIGLESIATFSGGPPLDLTIAPDGTDRMFIAGQTNGQVQIYKNGTLQETPFLNIPGTTTGGVGAGIPLSPGGEKGLLGMAFHPNFAAPVGTPGKGKFYTYTSEPKGGTIAGVDFIHDEQDDTNLGDHDAVFREWNVSGNADRIDHTSSRVLLRIRHPQGNHNGGAIRFGPDNNLYIAMGDGGGGNDNFGGITAPTDGHTNTIGNAQDMNGYALARNLNVFGKVLRIDPLQPAAGDPQASANGQYRIPAGNPFIAAPAADEIYAYGLRNHFRMAFDRVSGTLYAGDVGQGEREEVDIITSGGNYGWVYNEGNLTNRTPFPPDFTPIAPIAEYTHSDGQAIIGGNVYRGQNIPELYGKYVFGELGWNDPVTPESTSVGRLFYMEQSGGTINGFQIPLNTPGAQLYAFGEDKDGELYAMFADGNVARILGRQWLTNGGGSWNTSGNWLAGITNAAGASANFLGRLVTPGSSPATVNLDGNKTVGALRFNNTTTNGVNPNSYVVASGTGGTLTIDGGASDGLIQVIRGTHTISAPLNVASNTDVDVATTGALNVTSPLNISAGQTLTKIGTGTLTAGTINGGTLSIQSGKVALALGQTVSRLAAINVTSGAFDVTDNRLIVSAQPLGTWNGSSYTDVTGLIDQGRGGQTWDGDGIITSQSDALGTLTTIGVTTGALARFLGPTDTDIWSGQTINGTSVLVMYSYTGDANLDGIIDGTDYFYIDSNVGTSADGYGNGDFNYDGVVDGTDYFYIDSNIVDQGPPFAISAVTGLVSVPEPSAMAALALGIAVLCTRRCRRRRAPLR